MIVKKLRCDDRIAGSTDVTIGDFWPWACSDILSNRNRPIFAEFVVGYALGVVESARTEWDDVDHQYDGKTIKVKLAAYVQTGLKKNHRLLVST
jgi:hypothetical protein